MALAFFVTAEASAQDGKRRKMPEPEEVVKRLDEDKDGKISKAEAENAPHGRLKEHFDMVDANKDSFVDAEELKRAREHHRKGRKKRK